MTKAPRKDIGASVRARLLQLARQRGGLVLCDGSNADDTLDYRPGARAAREIGVRSPLREVGLSKDEIERILDGVPDPVGQFYRFNLAGSLLRAGVPSWKPEPA